MLEFDLDCAVAAANVGGGGGDGASRWIAFTHKISTTVEPFRIKIH